MPASVLHCAGVRQPETALVGKGTYGVGGGGGLRRWLGLCTQRQRRHAYDDEAEGPHREYKQNMPASVLHYAM